MELKYAYAVVQLFSHDILSVLLSVLLKLCQSYVQPAVHGPVLAGPQGSLLLSTVHPSLRLIRRLLSQLIRCRDADFNDLTAVPVLLQTYALVSAVPASSLHHAKVAECCADIVATLLAYSQPSLQADPSGGVVVGGTVATVSAKNSSTTPEDALSRSLWTQMVHEILKYILFCSGPAAFITGLQVLSEILPLPLPLNCRVVGAGVMTTSQLSEEDTQEILNARKLWSVHLHTLGPQIQQVVRLLCCSGPQLLQLLRKVCVQIADLSATTALMIARAALDAVLASCLVAHQSKDSSPLPPAATTITTGSSVVKTDQENEKEVAGAALLPAALVCSTHSARVLNFLSAVIPYAPVKAAALQLCRGGQKSDEKYADFLPCLCLILNSVSAAPAHIQSQECVVSILASLLDADICLLPAERSSATCPDGYYETYLSAALPSRDALLQIVTGLWDHLAHTEHNYSSLLPTLRTLTLLAEHNYTFQQLQRVLERQPQAGHAPPLWAFFSKMTKGFSKDSSDYLSTLSTALELLRILVRTQPGGVLHSNRPARTLILPVSSLAAALQWKSETEEGNDEANQNGGSTRPLEKHPLLILQDLLREHSTEEESMESLREGVGALIEILLSDGRQPIDSATPTPAEIVIAPPEPLSLQFSQRPLLTETAADEDRLLSSFWLNPPHHPWVEEADAETDHVRCDLLEIAQSCLPGVDLIAETERICKSHSDPAEVSGQSLALGSKGANRKEGKSSSTELHQPGMTGRVIVSTSRDSHSGISKPYVAPMRGRGFGRLGGGGGGVNSRNDPFRSRAPNTSRPPSLHVDDFVAMEKNNGIVGGAASSSASGGGGAAYGAKTARGRGGNASNGASNRGRAGFTASNSGARFNNFQAPRREASNRTSARPVGSTTALSTSSAGGSVTNNKWDDAYGSTRFPVHSQSSNRVWTNTAVGGGSSTGSNAGGSASVGGGVGAGSNSSRGSSKERYPSPSSNASSSSAGRPRHSRTFSR